jgi:D-alanyl-D-alanine carboxypeptidase
MSRGNVARTIAVAAGAIALLAPSGAAGRTLSPSLRAQVDKLAAAQMSSSDFPGLVVGVHAPGRGDYLKAYGRASLATGRRTSVNDRFRIGSVTKTFTATVILRLVQERQLKLEDHLSKWFPKIPNSRLITIRMLLNHTSGLPNLPANLFDDWANSNGGLHFAIDGLVAAAVRQPIVFSPGKGYDYTNTEYLILGQIAQQVARRSLRQLYAQYVIGPLRLRHTSYQPNRVLPTPNVRGYWLVQNQRQDVTTWDFSWAGAAGAMSSTVPDLMRYAPALATGHGLLNAATQRQRLTTVDTGQSIGLRYGLGIFTVPVRLGGGHAKILVGHDGEVPGWNAIVLYSPQYKASFVVLGNTAPTFDVLPKYPSATEVIELAADIFATLY